LHRTIHRYAGAGGLALVTSLPLGAFCARATAASNDAIVTAQALPERASSHRLIWQFPRFRTWQYLGIVAVSGTNLYIEFGGPQFPDQSWNQPVLMDLALRSTLRLRGAEARRQAAQVSDYLWYSTQYYTVVVDSLLVPLVFDRGNFDVAWQMTMLNWQVLGLSFLATRLAHMTVGRSRPSEYGCSDDPGASNACSHAGPSFFSGHSSMSAAGAGLACAHHFAMPLYANPAADASACVLLTATAITVGTLRVAADRHWASDVVSGWVIGGTIGFGLPWMLHYSQRLPRALGARFLPEGTAILPTAGNSAFGLSVVGLL
jgi:membrane-associated phospholipid phosphatase